MDSYPFLAPEPKPLNFRQQLANNLRWLPGRVARSVPGMTVAEPGTLPDLVFAAASDGLFPTVSGPAVLMSAASDATAKTLAGPVVAARHPLVDGLFRETFAVRDVAMVPAAADDTVLVWCGTKPLISLRPQPDSDAALLEDIAKRGKGRIQFTDDAAEIPQLFAQEAMTVARKSFIEGPVGAQATGHWSEVSPQAIGWLEQVDGYNPSYARPEATVSLATRDEYLAPLVATMRRGLGRTGAVTFPLAGDFSDRARQWAAYADFTKTLARWLVGDEVPAGLGLAKRLEGNRLTMDLYYAGEAWSRRLSSSPPRLKLSMGGDSPEVVEIPWQRLAPRHFSASVDLEENDTERGVVQAGDHALPFGPLNVGVSAEWAFEPERLADLRMLFVQSGGRELLRLSDAWLRPAVKQMLDLRLPLALLILIGVLLDALATRMGLEPRWADVGAWVKSPTRRFFKKTVRPPKPAKQKPAVPVPPPVEEIVPAVDDDARRRRFDRAKRGK